MDSEEEVKVEETSEQKKNEDGVCARQKYRIYEKSLFSRKNFDCPN
jgi:hypothetical protein